MDDSNKQQPEQPQSPEQSKSWRHKKKHSSRKKWLIIVLVVLVLFIGGAVVGWFWFYPKEHQISIVNRTDDEIQQIVKNTEQLNNDGQPGQSESELQKAIKETSNISQKADLLDGLSYVYYDNGDYDKSLAAALEVESLNGNDVSDGTKAFIASLYEAMGDKQNAIKYYQQAIELLDNSYPWYESRLSDYKNSIIELGGTI